MKDIGTVVRDRYTVNSGKNKTDMPSILYLDVIPGDPTQSLTLNGIRRYAAALGLKAVAGRSQSLDRLIEKDSIRLGYKLTSGNVGVSGKKVTLPHYMAAFLNPEVDA